MDVAHGAGDIFAFLTLGGKKNPISCALHHSPAPARLPHVCQAPEQRQRLLHHCSGPRCRLVPSPGCHRIPPPGVGNTATTFPEAPQAAFQAVGKLKSRLSDLRLSDTNPALKWGVEVEGSCSIVGLKLFPCLLCPQPKKTVGTGRH